MAIDPRVKKIMFAWLAVSVCLLAVACGSKRKNIQPPVEAPRTPPASPAEPSSAEPLASAPTEKSELDADSGRAAQTPEGSPPQEGGAEWERAEKLARADESTRVRVETYDPSDFTRLEQGRIGAPSSAGGELAFTGAAEDNLVALLKDRMDGLADEAARARNLQFAKEVGLTSVDINWSSRTFRVAALLERYGKREHYFFDGSLGGDLMGAFGNAGEWPNIEGDLVCMDLNGGCRNMRIRLVDKQDPNAERTAYVVTRDTPAWMYTKAKHPDASGNQEFRRLAYVFFNTIARSGDVNTVNFLNLTTSETINGSSTFVATMKIRVPDNRFPAGGEQVLMWTGPLVALRGTSVADVAVSNAVTVTRRGGVTVPLDHDNGHISDSIRRTRLIENDGKGKIQLAITVRANAPGAQEETILLTITGHRNQVKYKDL